MAILIAACLSGPDERSRGDLKKATGDHLPYQQPGNDTWETSIFWTPAEDVPGHTWPIDDTVLRDYPAFAQMIELGKLLEDEQWGSGHFDAYESYRFCEYGTNLGWQYPDGNNGTRWGSPLWELEGRVYWFVTWSSESKIAC